MSPLQAFGAFVVAAALVTLAPGLDTALVLRTTAAQGRRAGALAALGIGLGCMVWGAAAALGLGALLLVSKSLYALVRLVGAAYLIWMGAHLLVRPRTHMIEAGAPPPRTGRPSTPFWRGLGTNLLNPKVGVFYVSFLPAFAARGVAFAPWGLLLTLTHVILGLVWFALIIRLLERARAWLDRPAVVGGLDRITGLVFIGFGADLALGRR